MHTHDDQSTFRFCPRCGGALSARVLKSSDPARLVCAACEFVFYLDPKVAVGTIIEATGGGIVLVRRGIDPGYGKWVFPGGYVDRGEEVRVAAIRETREETGLEVRIEGLINVYSYPGRTPVLLVFAASIIGGEMHAADAEECTEIRAFGRAEIPWDELAFHSTRQSLLDYFAGPPHRSRRENPPPSRS